MRVGPFRKAASTFYQHASLNISHHHLVKRRIEKQPPTKHPQNPPTNTIYKQTEIPYPTQYASDSLLASTPDSTLKQNMYLFNCAQRAHYNFLENYVTFLPALLIAGLKYPVASSVLGAAWIVFRTLYATGYTRADKKDGKGRLMGAGFWLAQFALYGICGGLAWGMVV